MPAARADGSCSSAARRASARRRSCGVHARASTERVLRRRLRAARHAGRSGRIVDVAVQVGGEFAADVEAGAGIRRGGARRCSRSCASPTVLVLEDIHWADEATLDVIRVLGRRVGGDARPGRRHVPRRRARRDASAARPARRARSARASRAARAAPLSLGRGARARAPRGADGDELRAHGRQPVLRHRGARLGRRGAAGDGARRGAGPHRAALARGAAAAGGVALVPGRGRAVAARRRRRRRRGCARRVPRRRRARRRRATRALPSRARAAAPSRSAVAPRRRRALHAAILRRSTRARRRRLCAARASRRGGGRRPTPCCGMAARPPSAASGPARTARRPPSTRACCATRDGLPAAERADLLSAYAHEARRERRLRGTAIAALNRGGRAAPALGDRAARRRSPRAARRSLRDARA